MPWGRSPDREECHVALFGPPNVAKLDAKGNIDGLVKAAKYRKDPVVAEAARHALEGYLDRIIQQLQTKNLVQLNTCREALVLIGPPARDRLIFILKNGHVHRRQDAAYVLGLMKDPEAVRPLCVALHNPDPLLRMICVEALGKIGDPDVVDTLRRGLLDVDPAVSGAARKALKKIGALPAQK
jgi:HEAT repeat protein